MRKTALFAGPVAAVVATLGLLSACGGGGPAQAAAGEGAETGQALVTAAQRDREVTFYCSLTPASCEALGNGFEAKYPGVTVNVLRATSPDLSARYATERQSRAETADVILHADMPFVRAGLDDGIIMSVEDAGYLPADFPEEWLLNGSGVTGTPYYFEVLGIGINTDLVPEAERPTSWDDLTDPKWKGRMNGPDKTNAGYAMIYGTIDDSVPGFIDAMAKQEISPDQGGMVSMTESLAAGQHHLQVVSSEPAIKAAKEKGAPVDIVFPEPGATGPTFVITLNPEPGHPSAQKLFTEYLLSEDGNRTLTEVSPSIATPHVQPDYTVLHPNVDYVDPGRQDAVIAAMNPNS